MFDEETMRTLEQIIAEHPFWHRLKADYFPRLNECASELHFGMQQQIFLEGSDADRFYLIHAGRVALETFAPGMGAITIQTIGEGEALGWSWLFPPYRWHFSARSIDNTHVVAFDAHAIRQIAEEDHDFGYDITKRVGQILLQRLQATRMQLLDVYAPPA
jgi:CRP/FNR family transcriptional regulator, cyclic AMP receptor protein